MFKLQRYFSFASAIAHTARNLLKNSPVLGAALFDTLSKHVQAVSWIFSHNLSGPGGRAGEAILQGLKNSV